MAQPTTFRSFYQPPAGGFRTNLSAEEIVSILNQRDGLLWVDVDSRNSTEWLALAQTVDFHPLTIEDTLSPESRLKIEEYEGYLFGIARELSFNTRTADPYDFESCNISWYLGKTFFITVHHHPSRSTDTVVERLENAPELMDRGVDYLAYATLDALTDSYFPLLDEIDEFVDELETQIFDQAHATETLEKIFALKRTLLSLRRHQAPMREIMATLSNRPTQYLQPSTQIYFRDVYDHVVRQVESIETYRDLLTGAIEIYFSVVSNRMNEVMKALTIVGTFLLPATWVASIYGMNFEWMPWLHHRHGFWIAMMGMFGISALLLGYLKAKKWV